jgi:hypothetical protein
MLSPETLAKVLPLQLHKECRSQNSRARYREAALGAFPGSIRLQKPSAAKGVKMPTGHRGKKRPTTTDQIPRLKLRRVFALM